jgi:hypothetical protein
MRLFKECYLYPLATKEFDPSLAATPPTSNPGDLTLERNAQCYNDLSTVYDPSDVLQNVKDYVQGRHTTMFKVKSLLFKKLNNNANYLLQKMINSIDDPLYETASENQAPNYLPQSSATSGMFYFLSGVGTYLFNVLTHMIAGEPTGIQVLQGTDIKPQEDGLRKQKIITEYIDPITYQLNPVNDISDEPKIIVRWEPLLKPASVKEMGSDNIKDI